MLVVIDRLKQEFLIGYRAGWDTFWSPIVALWRSLARAWRTHFYRER
jgi:hypothetical protein